MFPDRIGGSNEVFIERDFLRDQRTFIGQFTVLIDHVQNIIFVKMRRQRKETALERAILSRTAGSCFTVKKIDSPMPAGWKSSLRPGASKYQNRLRLWNRRNQFRCCRCSMPRRKAVRSPDPEEKPCRAVYIVL